MMDKIILGLVSKKDLTVYDIKILMDKSISMFYSNSFGSINPAVKKLEKQRLINCTESTEKNRLKKTYNITKLGIEAYKNWLSEPIKQGRIKDDVLLRIFFIGDSDKKEQKKLLNEYISDLEVTREELENRKKEIISSNLSKENKEKIRFQMSTLQFGIDYYIFKEKWLNDLKNNL